MDDIFEILRDPDAREWDSGAVLLNDGYRLQLWSDHTPAPLGHDNESLEDFTTRQRAARTARINILANRAERTGAARKTYEEAFLPPPPPRRPSGVSPTNSVVNAERFEKQVLLKRLAN